MSDSQEQLSKQTADLQVLLSKVITLPSLNLPFHTHNEDLFWAKSEELAVANQTQGHQLLIFHFLWISSLLRQDGIKLSSHDCLTQIPFSWCILSVSLFLSYRSPCRRTCPHSSPPLLVWNQGLALYRPNHSKLIIVESCRLKIELYIHPLLFRLYWNNVAIYIIDLWDSVSKNLDFRWERFNIVGTL